MPFRSKLLIEASQPPALFSRRKHGMIDDVSARHDRLEKLLAEIRCYGHQQSLRARMLLAESDAPSLERSFEFSDASDPPSSEISVVGSEEFGCEVDAASLSCHEPLSPPLLVTVKQEPATTEATNHSSFTTLRVTYLLVTLVIMLADGLQGTHLYVLYESYGYSVASLYCLGFLTGGLMSPVTGPLVDRIGRKRSAMLYCLLEMLINGLEQYPYLIGLVASRMIGGFTTNLLCQVFETWLDTEYRLRGLEKEKYEIIMRDSVIVSNLAAIFSGYLAHVLAESYGASGPFRGAVCCTGIALSVVASLWTENYGSEEKEGPAKDMVGYLSEAVDAFRADTRMLRVGAVQGLTAGSIQIFIFLWAPALRGLSRTASKSSTVPVSLDGRGEPAYGLIFGAFMAAGVMGGILAPPIRRAVTRLLSPMDEGADDDDSLEVVEVDGVELKVRPMAVEFLAAFCYLAAAALLLVPCLVADENGASFTVCLAAFLALELLIGVFLPCEGVIRSLYFPASARASVMSLPRIIVNGAVSAGVASTNYVCLRTAFAAVAVMMTASAALQLTLISPREWSSLGSRASLVRRRVSSLLPLPAPPVQSLLVRQGGPRRKQE